VEKMNWKWAVTLVFVVIAATAIARWIGGI
jgi:hypothetical protein